MPFQSTAQAIYLAIHEPKVYREFKAATPPGTKLPEHVKSRRKRTGRRN